MLCETCPAPMNAPLEEHADYCAYRRLEDQAATIARLRVQLDAAKEALAKLVMACHKAQQPNLGVVVLLRRTKAIIEAVDEARAALERLAQEDM